MKELKIRFVTITILVCLAIFIVFAVFRYGVKTGEGRITNEHSTESFNQTMNNADTITRKIWAYIGEFGKSPESLDNLIESGLLDKIPLNPYSNQEMQAISLGESPNYGDYTYLPAFTETHVNDVVDRRQRGFWFIVYGSFCNIRSYNRNSNILGHEVALQIAYESGTIWSTPGKGSPTLFFEEAPEVLKRIEYDYD